MYATPRVHLNTMRFQVSQIFKFSYDDFYLMIIWESQRISQSAEREKNLVGLINFLLHFIAAASVYLIFMKKLIVLMQSAAAGP